MATMAAPAAVPPAAATERNKALVRRFVDQVWNAADLAVADQLFAADCVPHALQYDPGGLGDRFGPKHVKLLVKAWRTAFPDWVISVTDLIAEDDRVVLVSTGRGTHRGALMGVAPTGRPVSLTGVRTFRIADGKIAEYWVMWDWLGLWQQLGALPSIRPFSR